MPTTLENVRAIRQRIEKVDSAKVRQALMYQYLTGCRVSEAVGKYAPVGKDLDLEEYQGHPLAKFRIKTAKHDGEERVVCLPMEPEYESWTKDLAAVFEKRGSRKAFPVGMSTVQAIAPKIFDGLSYSVKKYTEVQKHDRTLCTHGLRHFRVSELFIRYGFDETDLNIFFGWKSKAAPMLDVYGENLWVRYLPKLLKA